jgi:hypothetical protein
MFKIRKKKISKFPNRDREVSAYHTSSITLSRTSPHFVYYFAPQFVTRFVSNLSQTLSQSSDKLVLALLLLLVIGTHHSRSKSKIKKRPSILRHPSSPSTIHHPGFKI